MATHLFRCKQFSIWQERCAMKVGTDALLLGSWAEIDQRERRVLDIGTGTGILALMVAQRNAETSVDGVELDWDSAESATHNTNHSPWSDRIKIHHKAIQDFRPLGEYDLIVCNPPFFSKGIPSAALSRRQARHTTHLTHAELLVAVDDYLAFTGRFCTILPTLYADKLQADAPSRDLFCSRRTEVSPFPEKPANRILLQFQRTPTTQETTTLTIYNAPRDYTDAYRDLTRAFYFNF